MSRAKLFFAWAILFVAAEAVLTGFSVYVSNPHSLIGAAIAGGISNGVIGAVVAIRWALMTLAAEGVFD